MNKNVFRKPRVETKFTWAMPRQERGRMKSNDLIKQCRYYKGEKENPFEGKEQNKAMLWFYEKIWFCQTIEEKEPTSAIIMEEFDAVGLNDLIEKSKLPKSLIALIFNRYAKTSYSLSDAAVDFRKFFSQYYE